MNIFSPSSSMAALNVFLPFSLHGASECWREKKQFHKIIICNCLHFPVTNSNLWHYQHQTVSVTLPTYTSYIRLLGVKTQSKAVISDLYLTACVRAGNPQLTKILSNFSTHSLNNGLCLANETGIHQVPKVAETEKSTAPPCLLATFQVCINNHHKPVSI